MLRWIPIVCLLVLASCGFTPQGDAARMAAQQYGAQAMDEALVNTEWFMCNGASIGAIKRRYGSDPERAAAWRAICNTGDSIDIILTPE